jgi:hypothetical protein
MERYQLFDLMGELQLYGMKRDLAGGVFLAQQRNAVLVGGTGTVRGTMKSSTLSHSKSSGTSCFA